MNSQSGQALPLALMAMVVGALVITPFLSNANSSIIGSRVYEGAIMQQDSADAGVEHGIWRLTNDGLADQLASPGDNVTYQLSEAVNDVAPTITVIADEIGGGGSSGNITDTVIDTLDFETNGAEPAKIISVSGDIYAIVYTDSNNDGWVKTVEVADNGEITDTAIDSLEFDTKEGQWTDIIRVSGDIYAIAYQGNKSDGYVKTVEIASDGAITNTVVDSLEFDTKNCIYPEILHVSGDIYAIAYQGNKSDGYVKTVEIASDGAITNTVVDSLEFDTSNGKEPDIIHISGDIYAIAYRGSGRDGFLKTVEIATDGNITNTVVDTFEFNPEECYFPNIIHVSGDVFAIAYAGASPGNGDWWGGILTTVEIAADGDITNSVIDEVVFDNGSGEFPNMVHVGGDVYAIAYTGPGYDGWLETVEIASTGAITEDIIDSLEFDNRVGYCPDIIHVSGNVFAIAYTGTNQWHGILKTIEITTTGGTSSTYEVVSAAGDSTIRALVSIASENVSVLSWQFE